MSRAVKIAVAGVGLVGRRHADAIRQLKHVELCGIVDPSSAGRRFAADQAVPCYNALEELFAQQMPDGIVLATPTSLHAEQGLACVAKRCPVLVEKPLATNAAESKVLVEAAEAASVPLLVGHHRRHNPLIRKAHEIISSGLIGEVRAVHVNCWFYKPDSYFEDAPWRKQSGAGPISVNLAHDVDLIRYLCGEVESVQAQTAPSARGFENEDVAASVLRLKNGALATVTVSDSVVAPWSWELTSKEYPIYAPTLESCYLIGGSHGSLSVPDLRLWQHQGGVRDWWSPISATTMTREASDPLVNQMTHFAEVATGRADPLVSGREGMHTLEVLEAIHTASDSGEKIILEGARCSENAIELV